MLSVIDVDQQAKLPWRNGGGVTTELAIWPVASSLEKGDYDWRVSLAEVTEASVFSRFEEHDRILTVVEGQGMDLEHGSQASPTSALPLEPCAFAGSWPTSATLREKSVKNFNLVYRPDRLAASAAVLDRSNTALRLNACAHSLVYCSAGSIDIIGALGITSLVRGQLLWARDEAELELRPSCDRSTGVVLRIERRPD